ncbi:MAG: hypothetical protein JRI97_03925, partial [Deltaproteobacteria bacterium]|nr:hypothetical protein [Deltaproteobacteria bacterium]
PLAVLGYKRAHPGPPERLEILYEETSHGLEEEFSRLYRASGIPLVLAHVVMEEGRAWVYDLDCDPLFRDLPGPYQDLLARELARSLAGAPPGDRQPLGPATRPVLAVSRMLADLFAFERRKHEPNP